jgi:hypothetical protein
MSILGVDAALYSILTYVAAARTLDFVLYGIDELASAEGGLVKTRGFH